LKFYTAEVRFPSSHGVYYEKYFCIFADDENEAIEIARRSLPDAVYIYINQVVEVENGISFEIEVCFEDVTLDEKYKLDNPITWRDKDMEVKCKNALIARMQRDLDEEKEKLWKIKNQSD
jgi:hypothetical protein